MGRQDGRPWTSAAGVTGEAFAKGAMRVFTGVTVTALAPRCRNVQGYAACSEQALADVDDVVGLKQEFGHVGRELLDAAGGGLPVQAQAPLLPRAVGPLPRASACMTVMPRSMR